MRIFERLDEIVRWVIIGFLGLLPFFFLPVAWTDAMQSKVLLAAIVCAVVAVLWVIARFNEGSIRMPWTLVCVASVFVPLMYAISTAVTGFASVSLVGSGTESDTLAIVSLGFAMLVLTASVFGMHPRRTSQALRALIFGGFVALLLEVVHLAMPSFALGGAFTGSTGNAFGSWHELAIFAGLLLILSLSLLDTPVTAGFSKYVAWVTAALAGIFIVISNYFDVLTLLMIAFLLLILARGYRAKMLGSATFWKKEWKSVKVIVLSLFFIVFGAYIVNVLPAALKIAQTDVRPSWQGTLAIGQQSLTKPATLFFGAGPNTFTREWGLYKPVEVNQTPFWNTDFSGGVASVPTAFITVGLLGLLAWFAFIVTVLWMIVRFWASSAETPLTLLATPLSIVVLYLLSLQALTIPGTVLTMLLYLTTGLLIALLAPTYIHERKIPLGTHGVKSWFALGGVVIASLALLGSSLAIARVVYAEMLVNKAITTYNQSQNIEGATAYISKALHVYPSDDRAHRAAIQLGLFSLQKLIASPDASQDAAKAQLQATLKDTIQHGLDAVALNGNNYQNWLSLASLYAQLAGSNIQGAYENARTAFEKALAENPTSPVPYINLAQLELLQNNPAAALQDLAKAVQLKPDFAAGYYIASQIYAGQKDYQTALQAAANAAKYASGDSEAWYNLGVIAYAAKDYQDAAASLQQALVVQPQFANAMYVLGLTYYQAGDTKDALAQFQALDKLDPGQAVVGEIIANLEAGKPLPQAQTGTDSQSTSTTTPAKAPAKK